MHTAGERLTCKELGGKCDQKLSAGSWDEMVQVMTKHVMEKHPDVAKEIEKMHNADPKSQQTEVPRGRMILALEVISAVNQAIAKPSMSVMAISRQTPRLEQLATKRVLLGTNLGYSALIHPPPSRSSNLILWRRSARGACLFLLAVLGCLQARAQQKPASPLDEFERRFAAANSAKEEGDLPSEKIVALGLREMGKLRLFEAAYLEAARFSRRSLEFEDGADAHVELAAANLFTSRLDEALKDISQTLAAAPRNATAWTIQGQAQMKKKDYRAAVESFQKSLEIRPDRETSTVSPVVCSD